MERQFLALLLLVPGVFSLQHEYLVQPNASSYFEKLPLCLMGCKCPTDGWSTTYLDCNKVGLNYLPSSLFLEAPLNVVSFQNNHIISLNESTFSRAENIEILDFSLNKIEKIDVFTFTAFKNLKQLKLSHNRLSEINPGVFQDLANLRVLELGHNTLLRLSPQAFQSTPNLLELRLQYNPLFDLTEDTFWFLSKLEKLDLESTGLVTLADQLFAPTSNLHWLSLSSNAFEIVPRTALARSTRLENLDLSGNDFTIFAAGDFGDLPSLRVLYLNGLPMLERVEKEAFIGLTGLETFSLSFNPNLQFVDPSAFGSWNESALPRRQLYLRENSLKTLTTFLNPEQWWTSIGFVDLADNPWVCNCDTQWMKKLKLETQMNMACDFPSNLHGRPFGTVHPSELMCQDTLTLAIHIAIAGFAVALAILALATIAVVCARSPGGLLVRAKKQFSYVKVDHPTKQECVDLEWNPSCDI